MSLFPASVEIALAGIPRGYKSQVYLVDPVYGNDSAPGTKWNAPLKTVLAGYNKLVDGRNDTLCITPSPTQNNLAASLDWTKSYAHMVGLGANLPGIGQRARITSLTTAALVYTIDFQGNACMFKNLNIQNECVANQNSGAAIVEGMRNYFENVFMSGMISSVPAARSGSYSVAVQGPENYFLKCAIGVATICRTQSNAELYLSGSNCKRNYFNDCKFTSQSVTAGKRLVEIAAATEIWDMTFENCLFHNFPMTAGGAAGSKIDHAIVDGATMTHQIIFKGKNEVVGCTAVADVVTYIWTTEPAPAGVGAHIALDNLST